jgi:hypothetical protein
VNTQYHSSVYIQGEARDIRGLGLTVPGKEPEKLITLIVWCHNFSAVRPEPENSGLSSGQFWILLLPNLDSFFFVVNIFFSAMDYSDFLGEPISLS